MSICTAAACRQPVRWALTPAGKLMPLDVHPDPDGNVVLTGKRVHFRGRLVDECRVENNRELFDEGVERYMPHHATCVAVDEFRRPAKKAKGSGDGRYHRSGFLKKFGA